MTEIVRRLDGIETVMARFHASLCGTSQVTTVLTLDGIIEHDQWNTAFQRLVASYDTLRLRIIEDEEGGFLFARGAAIPARSREYDRASIGRIEDLIELEVNDILVPSIGLWRYRVVHDLIDDRTHLFFTRHHAISDGFTTERLLSDLFQHLNCEKPLHLSSGSVPHTLGPAALIVPRNSTKDTRVGIEDPDLNIPHIVTASLEGRSTGIVSRVVSAADLARLTQRCRSADITVHVAITTAFAAAFVAAIGRDHVDLFTAVSRRRSPFLERPITDVGCFIEVVRSRIDFVNSAKQAAQAYASDLKWAADSISPEARSPEQIYRSAEFLATTDRYRGIAVTNLGSLHLLGKVTKRRILDFWSVANRSGGLFALALHCTFFDDMARLTLTFPCPLTPDTFARAVLDATLERLELAA